MKTVIVISKKWRSEVASILNATGHVAQSLGIQSMGIDAADYVEYQTAGATSMKAISKHPVVILTSTPGKMWEFKQQCEHFGLLNTAFVETMFHGGNDAQLASTLSVADDAHDLVCVGAFGEAAALSELTKKFSLLRA